MSRISLEIQSQIVPLYNELGTYAAVARKLGISASTVSKYVRQQKSEKTYTRNDCHDIYPIPLHLINWQSVIHFTLTSEEHDDLQQFAKEICGGTK